MLTGATIEQRADMALGAVDRRDFVLHEYRDVADVDEPLPIGYGQTISQPTTVSLMLQWLDVRPGQKVLDVGSGSGWTTALLAWLVGRSGRVYGVERIPELVSLGQRNCARRRVDNAWFYQAGAAIGLPAEAPFDRILVSASADEIPEALCDQVTQGGKIVIPVHTTILELTRGTHLWRRIPHPGFVFVPLL